MEEDDQNDSIRRISRSPMRRGGNNMRKGVRRRAPASSKSVRSREHEYEEDDDDNVVPTPKKRRRRNGFSLGRIVVFLVIGAAVIGTIIGIMSTTLSSYSLSVTLDQRNVSLPETEFTASKLPLRTGDLRFNVLIPPITIERSRTEAADGSTDIDTKARGTLTVYNTNPKGQALTLRNKTRFQAASGGQIYRMQGGRTIPGGKTVGGKFQPGKLDVTVEADEDGKDKNISKVGARFTIPGLANAPAYKDSYAVLKTPLKGGNDGERFYLNKDKETRVHAELENEIKEALLQQAREAIAKRDGHLFFEDGFIFESVKGEDVQGDNTVTVQRSGTLHVFYFREEEVARLLDEATTPFYSVQPKLLVSGATGLNFKVKDKEELSTDVTEFTFTLSGDATISWDIDDASVFQDVKGKSLEMVDSDLRDKYPFITKIQENKVFPFWVNTVPKSKSKFTYTETRVSSGGVATGSSLDLLEAEVEGGEGSGEEGAGEEE